MVLWCSLPPHDSFRDAMQKAQPTAVTALAAFLVAVQGPPVLSADVAFGDVNADSLRVTVEPYVRSDAERIPLRACVLMGKGAAKPDYRLLTVSATGTPAGADTTTVSVYYRLVVRGDTLREAKCSLDGSLDVARAVLKRLQHGDEELPVQADAEWGRNAPPPLHTGVLECETADEAYRGCWVTETAETEPAHQDGLWNFARTPFVPADSTDYGVPGSGAMADDPDCLPCKLPSTAITPVDVMRQKLEGDPLFLIRNYGKS